MATRLVGGACMALLLCCPPSLPTKFACYMWEALQTTHREELVCPQVGFLSSVFANSARPRAVTGAQPCSRLVAACLACARRQRPLRSSQARAHRGWCAASSPTPLLRASWRSCCCCSRHLSCLLLVLSASAPCPSAPSPTQSPRAQTPPNSCSLHVLRACHRLLVLPRLCQFQL